MRDPVLAGICSCGVIGLPSPCRRLANAYLARFSVRSSLHLENIAASGRLTWTLALMGSISHTSDSRPCLILKCPTLGDHFKTGHRGSLQNRPTDHHPGRLVLPHRLAVWQAP